MVVTLLMALASLLSVVQFCGNSFPVVEGEEISTQPDTVTLFLPSEAHGTGLVAHNTLAGSSFYKLKVGDTIRYRGTWEVVEIRRVRATRPLDWYSDFVDLDTGKWYTSGELVDEVYPKGMLTLQTCLKINGDVSGGRYFVIARLTRGF